MTTALRPRPARRSDLDATLAVARGRFELLVREPTTTLIGLILPVLVVLLVGTLLGGSAPAPRATLAGPVDPVVERTLASRGWQVDRQAPEDALVALRTARTDLVLTTTAAGRSEVAFDAGSARSARARERYLAGDTDPGGPSTTPVVAVDLRGAGDAYGPGSAFTYPALADTVLFTFLVSVMAGAFLVTERKEGTLRRLLAAPVPRRSAVAGTVLANTALGVVQGTLLVVLAGVVLDVRWGNPLAVASLILVFAVVAAAAGVLIGTAFSTIEQAMGIGMPLSVGLGMLGGTHWPLSQVPDTLRKVGHLSPDAWAVDGWVDVVRGHASPLDIAPELGVLALYAVVLGLLAARRLASVLDR